MAFERYNSSFGERENPFYGERVLYWALGEKDSFYIHIPNVGYMASRTIILEADGKIRLHNAFDPTVNAASNLNTPAEVPQVVELADLVAGDPNSGMRRDGNDLILDQRHVQNAHYFQSFPLREHHSLKQLIQQDRHYNFPIHRQLNPPPLQNAEAKEAEAAYDPSWSPQGAALNIPQEWSRPLAQGELEQIIATRTARYWPHMIRNLKVKDEAEAKTHLDKLFSKQVNGVNIPEPKRRFLAHAVKTRAPQQKLKVQHRDEPVVHQWNRSPINELILDNAIGARPMAVDLANQYRIGGHFLEANTAQEEAFLRKTNTFLAMVPPANHGRDFYPQGGFKEIGRAYWIEDATPFEGAGNTLAPRRDKALNVCVIAGPDFRPNPTSPDDAVLLAQCIQDRNIYVAEIEQIWRVVLESAIASGSKTVILGAIACGVFRNNSYLVAAVLRAVLSEERYAHLRIVFNATGESQNTMSYPHAQVDIFRYVIEQLTAEQASNLMYDARIPVHRNDAAGNDRTPQEMFNLLVQAGYPAYQRKQDDWVDDWDQVNDAAEAKDLPIFDACREIPVPFQEQNGKGISPAAQAKTLLNGIKQANQSRHPFNLELVSCHMAEDLAQEIEQLYQQSPNTTAANIEILQNQKFKHSVGKQMDVMREFLNLVAEDQDPSLLERIRLSPTPNRRGRDPVPSDVVTGWMDKQEAAISDNKKGRLWLINNRKPEAMGVRVLQKVGLLDKKMGSAAGQVVQTKDVQQETQRRYRQLMKIAKRQLEEDLPGNVNDAGAAMGGQGHRPLAPAGKVGVFPPAPPNANNAAVPQKKGFMQRLGFGS